MKIFIDPGHGGSDPGAINTTFNLEEKNINLDISLRLRRVLEQKGYTVEMSRAQDKFVSLSDRAQLANKCGTDIFVSIHCNNFSSTSANGTETYCYRFGISSEKIAESVQSEMVSRTGLRDRGVKARQYFVLQNTNMPAILQEVAFMSNPEEAQLLNTPTFRQTVAEAIGNGLHNYIIMQ